jgi:FAD/FMN-containing dehydrogenase
MLLLPATADSIAAFIGEANSAPEELSTIANIMPAPPMPFLAKELHGKLAIFALMVYAGDPVEGEQAVAPFRKLAKPLADMLKPMRYPEIYLPEPENYHPVAAARTMFLDRVDRSVAENILDHLESSTAPVRAAQLRVLGGALARVPSEATAYAHRNSKIMANLAALYENPEEKSAHETWVAEFQKSIQQSDKGAYVNFLADEGEAWIHAAYPGPTWDRLREIKSRYDPDNFFFLNQNIPPITKAVST